MAEKVMIIRHAEKPLVPDGLGQVIPFGLLENGEHSKYGLTVRGWQRAGALATLFAPEGAKFRSAQLATPNAIFASAISSHSWSRRMQLTIAPLQQKLGPAAVVNTSFPKGEEERMVETALRCSGNVLVCWAHDALPMIAARIVGAEKDVPSLWPENRFDLVWVFDRLSGSLGWSFKQVPQLLLRGDSTDLIH